MENFMSRIWCFIIVINVFTISGFTQTDNIDNLSNIVSSFESLSAEFTQERRIELLDSIITVKGELLIKKPGLLRWEIFSPVKQIIVINKSFVFIKDELVKVKKYSLVNTPFMKDMLKIFINILENDWDKLKGAFSFSFSEEKSILTLIPEQKLLKDSIKKISIFIDKDKKHIKWLKMIENNGDYSLTIFNNIVVNKKVDNEAFLLT